MRLFSRINPERAKTDVQTEHRQVVHSQQELNKPLRPLSVSDHPPIKTAQVGLKPSAGVLPQRESDVHLQETRLGKIA
jgi:hypothetical protein